MCFNKEVSIVVFIIGLAAAIKLIYDGMTQKNQERKTVIGVIIFMISLMQLNEYFLWKFSNKDDDEKVPVDQETKENNYMANIFIGFTLYFQLVVSYLALLYFWYTKGLFLNFKNSKCTYSFVATWIITIFTICFMGVFGHGISEYVMNPEYKEDALSYKDGNTCRMTWGPFTSMWNNNPQLFIASVLFYAVAFFLISTLVPTNLVLPLLIGLVLIISFIYSGLSAESSVDEGEGPDKNDQGQSNKWVTVFGSIWCFLCIILSIGCVMFGWIDNPPWPLKNSKYLYNVYPANKLGFKC